MGGLSHCSFFCVLGSVGLSALVNSSGSRCD